MTVLSGLEKLAATAAMLAVAELVKVGPKGYIHGWIYVGVKGPEGIGHKINHPKHGPGEVIGHGENSVTVMHSNGAVHEYAATFNKQKPKFLQTSSPEGKTHIHNVKVAKNGEVTNKDDGKKIGKLWKQSDGQWNYMHDSHAGGNNAIGGGYPTKYKAAVALVDKHNDYVEAHPVGGAELPTHELADWEKELLGPTAHDASGASFTHEVKGPQTIVYSDGVRVGSSLPGIEGKHHAYDVSHKKIGTYPSKAEALAAVEQHHLGGTSTGTVKKPTSPALEGEDAFNSVKNPKLTSEQSSALSVYGQAHGYKVINPYLNHDQHVYNSSKKKYEPATPSQAEFAQNAIKHIDAIFDGATPLSSDIVVHRRTGHKSTNALLGEPGSKVGQTFTAKSYTSTTTMAGAKTGHGYGYESKPVTYEIRVPAGSKVVRANDHEREVLLPRNAQLKVISDEQKPDGTRHAVLEYVPPAGKSDQELVDAAVAAHFAPSTPAPASTASAPATLGGGEHTIGNVQFDADGKTIRAENGAKLGEVKYNADLGAYLVTDQEGNVLGHAATHSAGTQKLLAHHNELDDSSDDQTAANAIGAAEGGDDDLAHAHGTEQDAAALSSFVNGDKVTVDDPFEGSWTGQITGHTTIGPTPYVTVKDDLTGESMNVPESIVAPNAPAKKPAKPKTKVPVKEMTDVGVDEDGGGGLSVNHVHVDGHGVYLNGKPKNEDNKIGVIDGNDANGWHSYDEKGNYLASHPTQAGAVQATVDHFNATMSDDDEDGGLTAGGSTTGEFTAGQAVNVEGLNGPAAVLSGPHADPGGEFYSVYHPDFGDVYNAATGELSTHAGPAPHVPDDVSESVDQTTDEAGNLTTADLHFGNSDAHSKYPVDVDGNPVGHVQHDLVSGTWVATDNSGKVVGEEKDFDHVAQVLVEHLNAGKGTPLPPAGTGNLKQSDLHVNEPNASNSALIEVDGNPVGHVKYDTSTGTWVTTDNAGHQVSEDGTYGDALQAMTDHLNGGHASPLSAASGTGGTHAVTPKKNSGPTFVPVEKEDVIAKKTGEVLYKKTGEKIGSVEHQTYGWQGYNPDGTKAGYSTHTKKAAVEHLIDKHNAKNVPADAVVKPAKQVEYGDLKVKGDGAGGNNVTYHGVKVGSMNYDADKGAYVAYDQHGNHLGDLDYAASIYAVQHQLNGGAPPTSPTVKPKVPKTTPSAGSSASAASATATGGAKAKGDFMPAGALKGSQAYAHPTKYTGPFPSGGKGAIKYYTGSGYTSINGYLRTGKVNDDLPSEYQEQQLTKHIEALDKVFDVMPPTTQSLIVRRGSNHGEKLFGKYVGGAVGKVFKDNGFVSTSTNGGFGGDTKIQIHVPAGAKVLKVGDYGGKFKHDETEFLLPRGSRFRVLSDTEEQSGYTKFRKIQLELIV